ncbi:DUF4922 domain-containing protein [Paludibacter sp. 221]|uniref:DUF4922 domain-containing protein n=1 Tax=Paludibacter sp. 221 TaxID=2302939 RepID=UPI0013D69E96|nr:DUF4922 domain-containing protein [Paludibacter sp. 221]NDV46996.1 DUF4922 domain-containing protein [Paludibacter sp. 221]
MNHINSDDIKRLFHSQVDDWALACQNYDALKRVQTKKFCFGDFSVYVQFNPARMVSSAAKVDEKTIKERKCFLCPANLPAEQKGIPIGRGYQVLVNPFPIFPMHFTVPCLNHLDQLIENRFVDMLDFAKSMDEFIVFYNGPKCGASAPDHMHFQLGSKGFLPVEKDVKNVSRRYIYQQGGLSLYTLDKYLRNVFVVESSDREQIMQLFSRIYSLLTIKKDDKEPMLNIVTWYESGKWICCIYPREVHRPKAFFAEGDDNILLSPGTVDMGGIFITPQEKDFIKITAEDIQKILKEVSISDEKMLKITAILQNTKLVSRDL